MTLAKISLHCNLKLPCIYRENVHLYWSINMCTFKENQHVAKQFCITDMDNLVSISWFRFKSFQTRTFFIFSGTKAETFGAKKEIFSVLFFTVLKTLLENSLYFLRLYGKVLLILKTSLITAGESPWVCLFISIAKTWIFLWSYFVYVVDFIV